MNKNNVGLLVMPVASVLLGLYLLFNPFGFTLTICRLIGLLVLLSGLGGLISTLTGFKSTSAYLPMLIVSIAALVGGIFLTSRPYVLVSLVNLIISVFLLVEGAANVQNGMARKNFGDPLWWLPLAVGVVCLLLGLATLFTPLGTNLLTQAAGLVLAASGVSSLLAAFGRR